MSLLTFPFLDSADKCESLRRRVSDPGPERGTLYAKSTRKHYNRVFYPPHDFAYTQSYLRGARTNRFYRLSCSAIPSSVHCLLGLQTFFDASGEAGVRRVDSLRGR